MDIVETLEENWPVIAGVTVFILLILMLTAMVAYRMCKRTYSELLEGAEGRVTLAEERVVLAEERAMLADERLSIIRDKLDNMQPQVFDAKIDEIVRRIKDVEYSRLNGIIAQLNDVKIGSETVQQDELVQDNIADVHTEPVTHTENDDAIVEEKAERSEEEEAKIVQSYTEPTVEEKLDAVEEKLAAVHDDIVETHAEMADVIEDVSDAAKDNGLVPA